MPRKIVFAGSVMTRDLTRDDEIALQGAFDVLRGLAERGAIEFRRNAGRSPGVERSPPSYLTPQGLAILRYGLDKDAFTVTGLRDETGFNKNSLAALLWGLAQTGYLTREPVRTAGDAQPGHRAPKWSYKLTDEGREVAGMTDDDEPESPAPGM